MPGSKISRRMALFNGFRRLFGRFALVFLHEQTRSGRFESKKTESKQSFHRSEPPSSTPTSSTAAKTMWPAALKISSW